MVTFGWPVNVATDLPSTKYVDNKLPEGVIVPNTETEVPVVITTLDREYD